MTALLTSLTLARAVGLFVTIKFLWYAWRKHLGARHLPPGPQGLPLIGNLLQIPAKGAFRKLRDLSKVYGEGAHSPSTRGLPDTGSQVTS